MRSEPITPVRGVSREARREGQATPAADAGSDAFEASLQRARRGRRGPDEDVLGQDLPPQPVLAAPPTQQAPRAEGLQPRWAPQPVQAPDAITHQLQVQALPDGPGDTGHWQLQITEAGLPVQRLDLQRSGAGPLTVVVSTSTAAQQTQHTTRLRQRLARSGARVDFRGPPTEQES